MIYLDIHSLDDTMLLVSTNDRTTGRGRVRLNYSPLRSVAQIFPSIKTSDSNPYTLSNTDSDENPKEEQLW